MTGNKDTPIEKYILPAIIGAIAAIATGWITFRVEDRKADAEFAQIALSILAADSETQNQTARRLAIDLLAQSLPIEITDQDREDWLSGGEVILGFGQLSDDYLRRIESEFLNNIDEYLGPRVSPPSTPTLGDD